MRPFAIHVERIEYTASLEHAKKRRIAVVDLEFTKPMLADHIQKLQNILTETKGGSVRVRFKGPMVLE